MPSSDSPAVSLGRTEASNWSFDFSDVFIASAVAHGTAGNYAAGASFYGRSTGGSEGAAGAGNALTQDQPATIAASSANLAATSTSAALPAAAGIDSTTFTYTVDEAKQIASSNYSFVGVYLAPHTNPLPVSGATNFTQAGLSIVSLIQDGKIKSLVGDLPNITNLNDPTIANIDAHDAIISANNVGQPLGSAIYFSIDSDPLNFKNKAEQKQAYNAIESYIQRIESAFSDPSKIGILNAPSNPYVVGVYGAANVLDDLLNKGIISVDTPIWLADNFGEKYQNFLKTHAVPLEQKPVEIPGVKNPTYDVKIGSLTADLDVTHVANYGQWQALTVKWQPSSGSGVNGIEGSPVTLDTITTTGSVSSLVVSGLPVDATLSDGTHSSTGNTSVDVLNWLLSNLTFTDPSSGNFTLTATATEETALGHVTQAATEAVTVNPGSTITFDELGVLGLYISSDATAYFDTSFPNVVKISHESGCTVAIDGAVYTPTNGVPFEITHNKTGNTLYVLPGANSSSPGMSYELDFTNPLSSIVMELVGFRASQSTSGFIFPDVTILAEDVNNNVLSRFDQAVFGSVSDIPAQTVKLAGGAGSIDHVVVYGNAEGFAGASGPLFDKLILVS